MKRALLTFLWSLFTIYVVFKLAAHTMIYMQLQAEGWGPQSIKMAFGNPSFATAIAGLLIVVLPPIFRRIKGMRGPTT